MVSPRARPNSDAVFLLGARGCERHNSERALSTRRTPRRLSRTHTFIFHRVRLFLYHFLPLDVTSQRGRVGNCLVFL
jgi:hypothetical protein